VARAETRSWYRVAIALHGCADRSLVAASGEHVGEALDTARATGWPIAVGAALASDIPLGESVGKHHVVALGDAPAELPSFRWPLGVVPELGAGAALAAIRPGWTERASESLYVVEAQTEADNVGELFMGLVERLPSADNLEIRVLDHFEAAGATDVWLTSRVNGKKIIRFLDDHDAELFGNGHIEIGVYVRAHKATLRMTEHKTIVWLAEQRALAADVARWLAELDVPRVDSLVTIRDAPHVHYRPTKSRGRAKLGEELYRQRLRKVAVETPPGEPATRT
jgi:hypothetical protein